MVKTVQLNLDLPAGERWKEIAVEFKQPVILQQLILKRKI